MAFETPEDAPIGPEGTDDPDAETVREDDGGDFDPEGDEDANGD